MKDIKFKPGEKLIYTGKGFIGFNPENRECVFVEYAGMFDAYIKYNTFQVLVSKYDLKKL